VSSVRGFGDLFTSIGRVTGLLGAYAALIQVVLLARFTWLEHLVGFDRLTVWHRFNGKLCLYLVLAHTLFITLGYASMDKVPVPTEVSRLLGEYTGVLAATIGTALMAAIVVTSLVIVRRKLRYETWYAIHFTVYLAIALAWFHQIPTGNEFSVNQTAADYWTSLYLATLALLLIFRVAVPVYQAFWHQMRVAEVIHEAPGVVSLRITGRHLDRLRAQGGQFFLWRFLSKGRWWASHPFSISESPNGTSLRITVKGVGDFTRRLGEIRPGTRVIAEGPFGVFTGALRTREKVAFIAGGIGITPIRAMLEEMQGDLVLIYRVMRESDLVFQHELDAFTRTRGIKVLYVIGDHRGPEGAYLMSPAHLRQILPDINAREIYVCGPPVMMDVMLRNLREAQADPRYIHTERFAL
jgi:predicted ferric reductase